MLGFVGLALWPLCVVVVGCFQRRSANRAVLPYSSLEHTPVVHERPYRAAPREFSGLGKRNRQERLALIEALYDRSVVGPAVLPETLETAGTDGLGHAVRAHWPRGHFHIYAFGPGSTQRKLVFVVPPLVRADRLSG